jgi:uncharacterized membrane protein YagU involved in acid resistance
VSEGEAVTESSGTILVGEHRPAGRGAWTTPRSRIVKSIVYGGLIAGTIDIGAASIISPVNPLIVLLAIASGLLGHAAFQGGAGVMVLGLLLQWGMSILIAAFFSIAANMWPVLARRWILWGAIYGVVVFVVMNYVVVPLSAAAHKSTHSVSWIVENLAAMLVFGWIVAFTAHRFLASRQT